MRTVRRLATIAAALTLTAAALLGSTGTAQAAAQSSTFTDSATKSTGTLTWDNSTYAISITAKTGQLAAGSCVTVYFDWRSNGHHDARAVRDCVSNDTYTYSFPDSNTSNLLGNPNRMGLCYGAQDTQGTCTYYDITGTPNIPMDWTPWPQPTWANPCVLSWSRKAADGSVTTFIDGHSQRRALVGTGC